jgi:hypothetical protein
LRGQNRARWPSLKGAGIQDNGNATFKNITGEPGWKEKRGFVKVIATIFRAFLKFPSWGSSSEKKKTDPTQNAHHEKHYG